MQTLTARAAGDVSISAKKLRVTQGLDKPTEAVEDILKVLDEEMGLNPRDENIQHTFKYIYATEPSTSW